VPRRARARGAYALASFPRRLAAYALDVGAPYALVLAVWIALGSRGGSTSNTLGALFLIAIAPYLLWSWTQGATLGMAALGMRIESENGDQVRLRQAAVRLFVLALLQFVALAVLFALLYLILYSFPPLRLSGAVVLVLVGFIVGGVALLYAALRGPVDWHDRVSHTVVLRLGSTRRGAPR